eukprot:395722_1
MTVNLQKDVGIKRNFELDFIYGQQRVYAICFGHCGFGFVGRKIREYCTANIFDKKYKSFIRKNKHAGGYRTGWIEYDILIVDGEIKSHNDKNQELNLPQDML